MPRAVKRIAEQVPEKVQLLYGKYPFEICGEPYIRYLLTFFRIRASMAAYQDCYDAALDAYLFSIHRCALCGYTGVQGYIRKLVPIAVKCALVLSDEGKIICSENGFKRVFLDDGGKFY